MKDLQKMREDFEKQIERERIANNLEERFGVEFYVFERFRGNGLRILARNNNFRDETISLSSAKQLLEEFPADEQQILNDISGGQKNKVYGFYRLCADRGFSARFTSLNVNWFYKGSTFSTCTLTATKYWSSSSLPPQEGWIEQNERLTSPLTAVTFAVRWICQSCASSVLTSLTLVAILLPLTSPSSTKSLAPSRTLSLMRP